MKLIGTLLSCKALSTTEYEAFITKATQYSARLLKKADQCKAVMMCSRLFDGGDEDVSITNKYKYSEFIISNMATNFIYFHSKRTYRNPQRVLECLQRSLKLADACTASSPTNVHLFVEIFESYLYFFERNNPAITDKFISGLIALITEHISSAEAQGSIPQVKTQFVDIVRYIQGKKSDSVSGGRFAPIVCNV